MSTPFLFECFLLSILFCNPNTHVADTGQTAFSDSVLIRDESLTRNNSWVTLLHVNEITAAAPNAKSPRVVSV